MSRRSPSRDIPIDHPFPYAAECISTGVLGHYPGSAGLQPGSRSHAGAWRSQQRLLEAVGNLTTSLLSFQAAFWRYRKAGQERGESLFSIRLMLLI